VAGPTTAALKGQVSRRPPASGCRLVIHSSAYTVSPSARQLQLRVAELAGARRWTEASGLLVDAVVPRRAAYLRAPGR